MTDAKRRKIFTRLRRELAAKLLHPDFPTWPNRRPSARNVLVADELENAYIMRENYELAISAQREAGVKRIWIHGDAGTGKTRLAAACHYDVLEADVPIIKATDEVVLNQSVAAFLGSQGAPGDAINSANIWALFLETLNASGSPTVIVMDEMVDGPLLQLLAQETRTTVIFTSTNRPPRDFAGYQIEVVDMSVDETAAMVRSRLPGLTDAEVQQMVQVTGSRALAIEHACAFVRETRMPVTNFCQALAVDPAGTLETAGEQFGRTLTAIYRFTLERLKSNPRSLWALDLLLFSGANSLAPSHLAEIWAIGTEFLSPGDVPAALTATTDFDEASGLLYAILPGAVAAAARGVRFLDDAALVEMFGALRLLERYGIIRARNDNMISMHQLTRRLLRSLRGENAAFIHAHLRAEVAKFLDACNWKGGEFLSLSDSLWVARVEEAIEHSWDEAEELAKLPLPALADIGLLTAALLRASRQIGIRSPELISSIPNVASAVFVIGMDSKTDEEF